MIQSEYKPGSKLFIMYHYMATVVKDGKPVEVPALRVKGGSYILQRSLSRVVRQIKLRHFPRRSFWLASKPGGGFVLSLVDPSKQ
jgi:hypothetical protein